MASRCPSLDSDTAVSTSLKIPNVIACIWSAEEKWDWFQLRHEVKRADSLVWTPTVGGYSRDAARHVYAHELGHMFGLAEHGDCVGQNVMEQSPPWCTVLATPADVTTARCVYIYYCP